MVSIRRIKSIFNKIKNDSFKEATIVLLILLTAFLFRYWHLTSTGWIMSENSPAYGVQYSQSSPFHFSDSGHYILLARDYLNGRRNIVPLPPPLIIFFLVPALNLTEFNLYEIQMLYAIMNTFAIGFIYVIARELFGKEEALLTILICSVSFTLIFITGALNIENLYLFTLALALRIFVHIHKQNGVAGYRFYIAPFFFGVASAMAALSRSEFLLILALLFFYGLFKKEWSPASKLKIVMATILGMSLLIAPWTYRNYVVMKKLNEAIPIARLPLFVPISINGPLNFAEGHNPKASGTFAPYFLGSNNKVTLDYKKEEHLKYIRDGYRIGWEFIKNNPGRELEMLPVKLKVFASGFSNGFLLDNFPVGTTGEAPNIADSFVPDSKALLPVGAILFLVGLSAICTRSRRNLLLLLPVIPIASVLFTTIVFYGLGRFAYPILPFYYMVISVGLVHIFRRFKARWPATGNLALAAVVVLLAIGFMQSRKMSVFKMEVEGEKTWKVNIAYSHSMPKDLLRGPSRRR